MDGPIHTMSISQRRYPRIASQHTVLVRKLEGDALEEFALTRTLAEGGCGFLSDERIGEGSTIELLIAIDHHVVKAKARVVYERPVDASTRTEVGVEFFDLADGDAERIRALCE